MTNDHVQYLLIDFLALRGIWAVPSTMLQLSASTRSLRSAMERINRH